MKIDFDEKFTNADLGIRIRAIMGVPEEILTDDIISSPTFKTKASKYVNSKILKYDEEKFDDNFDMLNIAFLYYISHLLCTGMYARLPKQMENKSTKTIMQSINWDTKSLELLSICDDTIDNVISEIDDDFEYGNSFAMLTDESEYPNTTI